ncbi:MAG: hypothetical protein ACPL4E_06340 [Thermoproteota archaeon]
MPFDLGETLVRTWIPETVFKRVLYSLGVDRSVEEIREALARTDEQFNNLNYRSLYGKKTPIKSTGVSGIRLF